jgi:hypothetical protein
MASRREAALASFEAILYDPSRFGYLLDFLSQQGEAHKLLFWLEVEQLRSDASCRGDDENLRRRRCTTFEKYFCGDQSLDLPEDIHVATSKLHERGCPTGLVFCLAHAFVREELRWRWFCRFVASPTHAALVDHLRMSCPISVPQLLVEGQGPVRGVLQRFLSAPGECPLEVAAAYNIWQTIVSSLRPLCAGIFKAIAERGPAGGGYAVAHLLEEIKAFQAAIQGDGSCIDSATRTLIIKRTAALAEKMTLTENTSGSSTQLVEAIKQAVNALGEALLQGQQQAYRVLDFRLLPALRQSKSFGAFAEETMGMECDALQARFRLLNDVADVIRRRSGRAIPYEMLATDGLSKHPPQPYPLFHLFLPCPSPVRSSQAHQSLLQLCLRKAQQSLHQQKQQVFMVPQSSEYDLEQLVLSEGSRQDPLLTFQPNGLVLCFAVDVKETEDLVDVEEGVAAAARSAHSSAGAMGVHGCLCAKNMDTAQILRRFRTQVKQLRHSCIARIVRRSAVSADPDQPTAPERLVGIGTAPSSGDSDAQQGRLSANEQLLEIMESDVLDRLPGYCLPTGIAFAGGSPNSSPPPTSLHHFVITVPRKRRRPESESPVRRDFSPRRGSNSGMRPVLPVAIDSRKNIVLNGACRTEWTLDNAPDKMPVWLAHCTVALCEEPLMDTLRAVAMGLKRADRELPKGGSTSVTLCSEAPSPEPAGWHSFCPRPIPYLDHPVAPLFKVLSPQNVLVALKWLVLERPVIVTGSSCSLIACACQSLRALLHPLQWHFPYAPLLPACEIVSFWKSKLIAEKGASRGRSPGTAAADNHVGLPSSPSISSASGENSDGARRAGSKNRGSKTSTASSDMKLDPFFVGLESSMLHAADVEGAPAPSHDEAGSSASGQAAQPQWGQKVWGLSTAESCTASTSACVSSGLAVHATSAPPLMLEAIRRMVARALVVDLDFDEISQPDGEDGPSWPTGLYNDALRSIQESMFANVASFDRVLPAKGGAPAPDLEGLREESLADSVRRLSIDEAPEPLGDATKSMLLTLYRATPEDVGLRDAFLQLMQSFLDPTRAFTSVDVANTVCRFDSGSYLAVRALELGQGGSELCRELFGTRGFAAFLSDVIEGKLSLKQAQKKLQEAGQELQRQEEAHGQGRG